VPPGTIRPLPMYFDWPKLLDLEEPNRRGELEDHVSLLKRFLGITASGPEAKTESPILARISSSLYEMDPEKAHYLAAFAFVLARAANADLDLDQSEVDAMVRATSSLGDLSEQESALVVEIATTQSRELGGSQNFLVTREFRSISNKEQRLALVECLYAISAADGTISTTESAEVLKISDELGLSRNENNALKAGWKEHLAEFQGLGSR
jgi:uncharacterized tellurite resistance protein B-like protein